MANLGSFGAAMRELDPQAEHDTFVYFGKTFTVHGNIPPVTMLQLGAAATQKIDQTEGMGALWEAMRCSLTIPEREEVGDDGQPKTVEADGAQFQDWYKLAVAKCDSFEELMRLAMELFQAQAGRPTEQRPALPAGPLPTSTPSKSSPSTPPAFNHLRPVDEVLAG